MAYGVEQRQGVAAYVRTFDNQACLLMPLFSEGKKEEKVGRVDWQLLVPGMYEMIGGGVESGETIFQAMEREILEERQLRGRIHLDPIPQQLEVYQCREGRYILFLVSMFLLYLSENQQTDLSIQQAPWEVADRDLSLVLSRSGNNRLFRPLTREMLYLAQEYNLWQA